MIKTQNSKQRTPHLNPLGGEEVVTSKKFPLPVGRGVELVEGVRGK